MENILNNKISVLEQELNVLQNKRIEAKTKKEKVLLIFSIRRVISKLVNLEEIQREFFISYLTKKDLKFYNHIYK
jgi:hypothetical protein